MAFSKGSTRHDRHEKERKGIILSGIDTVIAGKGDNTYTDYNLSPEEIERFVSSVREGKIGLFGNLPVDDLVLKTRRYEHEQDAAIKVPIPEEDFYEYRAFRESLLGEVYALAGLTRDAGWFEEDTPGIPKEKFAKAIEFVYMLPEKEGNGYLPHGIKASPDGTVTFWWKHHKKSVTFSITNFANSSWHLCYQGSFPQDNCDRFLTLGPNAIEYLVIDLKKMYS